MNFWRRNQPYFRSPTMSERSALEADRAHVARLDAQIIDRQLSPASLEQADLLGRDLSLYLLKSKRRDVLKCLNSYIYPVLTLPNEIVSEIFVGLLPGYPQRPSARGPGSPLKLGQICHSWREIAWTTPSLWRAIAVDSPRAYGIPASLPLSISLAFTTGFFGSNFGLLTAITRHSVRWEHVRLDFMPPAGDWLSLLRGSLPLLRSLDITELDESEPLITAFQDSPHLRTLSTSEHFSPARILLPLRQLTTLIMAPTFDTTIAEILDQTPNLVHFEARLRSDWDAPVPNPFVRLTVDRVYQGVVEESNLLDMVTLPALCTLHIDQALLGEDFVTRLTALQSRSGCAIQTLRVLNLRGREWGVSNVWVQKHFPTLRLTLAWDAGTVHDHLDAFYEHLDLEWKEEFGEDDSASSNSDGSDEDRSGSDEEFE
ncbi:hypothetical protein C8R46DRAFT_1057317 [Mycena filopes]|nr:hypothetical protein C8R46DRAFT_1057317 [Mycena filopes]